VSVPATGNAESSLISCSCGARNLLWVSVPRSSKPAVRLVPGKPESCVGSRSWERGTLCRLPFLGTRNPRWFPVPGNAEPSVVSFSCTTRNTLWVLVPRRSGSSVRSCSGERGIFCGFLFLGTRNLLWFPVPRNGESSVVSCS
jgi:hypothetical protein